MAINCGYNVTLRAFLTLEVLMSITLSTDEQRVSYGFGLQFGQQLLRNQFDGLDAELVAAGIQDIVNQQKIQVSEQELNAAFTAVQAKIEQQQAQKAKQMKELGITFLAENAKRDGVTVLASGLQYEVLESGTGTGASPTADSTVQTHYHGTMIDGTVFDSSVERGEPATFGVGQVIAGWTEALQLMKTGDKWRVFLPADLAYGDNGAPPSIPGGSALVFEIQLLDIVA